MRGACREHNTIKCNTGHRGVDFPLYHAHFVPSIAPGESVVAPGGSSTRQNFVAPEHLEYARELQAAGMQQAEFDR